LKKDAPLRTLCERERNAAAIQCYPDSAKDIAQLIDAEVGAAGLSIAQDAKAFLVSQLGQDRLSTRSELEKLVLYAHGADEITLDHVAAIVCDASNLIVGEAVNAAFDGGFAPLDARLRHIFAGASDYHALLAAALRHALDLHRARRDAQEGPREGSGFASAGFKQKDAFERHLRAWTRPSLGPAIDTLAEAIARARREPKLGPSLAARALWTIAQSARNKTAGC
ncbi:MAG: DNA polymerase III subunit delta, partial [Pseudomonadota bacterium]|nr:DNA polymerase III subunit delta [Pseudomonadota bacterium]